MLFFHGSKQQADDYLLKVRSEATDRDHNVHGKYLPAADFRSWSGIWLEGG